jgi:hypothetical protein
VPGPSMLSLNSFHHLMGVNYYPCPWVNSHSWRDGPCPGPLPRASDESTLSKIQLTFTKLPDSFGPTLFFL